MSKKDIELTILMPCLNESETLLTCITKAKKYMQDANIEGEVLIADNGSIDDSKYIAKGAGARVINVGRKGYGAALQGGISEARGKYIIMGDADDSYDFSSLTPFVKKLRQGNDLVMGNRFKGGIEKGAMPPLHKYLGNPILSFLGRLFFNIKCRDFHCGLRGFNKQSISSLNLHTTGMEFASEMVVRSSLSGLKLEEVPTTLSNDGRSRPPHLNTWRDGWRHLCFLLMYTPKWLYLYPAISLITFGLLIILSLLTGPVTISGIELENKTFFAGCLSFLLGTQALLIGKTVHRYAIKSGLLPSSNKNKPHHLESYAILGFMLTIIGIVLSFLCLYQWSKLHFGDFQSPVADRYMVLSLTISICGMQIFFSSFLNAIVSIDHN
ncbi:glycosyltransferase family 2 protein [Vibrio superstes]|uniref:Dolichol-P-glucose synthetase n=1 Tax=Vibrio superstes NBRC 103154 TaxID=1219062 RepID=A0A511QUI6_9VIBR|nr:glycosyltransferase family 2 protein [Vibrio superstes]GEM81028.1 dolichol-P-glucose synthetase [Vibrio superstes NBRC 103154]